MIRLDKYLADMSIGTRQEVKKYIRQGRVKINEDIIKKPEYKIREDEDKITFDGAPVAYETFEYYMLNKPAGVISATEDKRDKTVLDLIKEKKRKDLFPVGRLDKDTEGLLLITNDGALAHRLLSPKKHVDKCYYAKISGGVTEEDVRVFKERINIGTQEEPEWTMPAELKILEKGTVSRIRLTIREGKFHQVKRMVKAVGSEVLYLKRLSMGSLKLDEELKLGEYRRLTKAELQELKEHRR